MTPDEPGRDDAAAAFTELQNLLLATRSMEKFLEDVASLAAATVASGLSCAITLQQDGRPLTVATSDTRAAQVDEAQYDLDQGPCLHAMRSGQVVRIDDTAGAARWDGFAIRAAANGIRSCLSLPLSADGIAGALNLYSPIPLAFGAAETQRAQAFAAHASGILPLAARQASYAATTDQLHAALASRAVIDQALGVIMAQERCTHSRAFAILRSASQNRNVKLRNIAEKIVTSVSGEPPKDAPFQE